MAQLSKERVEEIANEVSDELTEESEFSWPDCWKAVHEIKERLVTQYSVDEEDLDVQEYQLPNEFGHYCLHISYEVTGESLLVDAAFSQFAAETGTPFDVGSSDQIDDVVVVSPDQYIFSQYKSVI
jgi:hypothetical protein